jgi:peptidoglycan/LPS O-acetylase OafA/YrhL
MDMHQPQNQANTTADHLPWLDGLRGGASLWVLLSHVQILSGLKSIPILSWGSLAVDLFMMLSGFLMAHHYIQRQKTESWDLFRTFFIFWIRRFFRIAPLYYVLLITALALGPWLGEYRFAIASVWPNTATSAERYFDHSIVNALAHMSFIFGFFPHFAFRTPLPDWSIGLEIQFYLAFPAIMLATSRIGPIKSSLVLIVGCLFLKALFPEFFHQFEMPTFLPIKLYIFLVGIWIAIARAQKSMQKGFFVSLSIAALWIIFERSSISVVRMLLIASMFYLMNNGTLPASQFLQGGINKIRGYLSGSVSKFMGDTSYATYLVHLIVILPIAGELSQLPQYQVLDPAIRFGVCLLLSMPIIYTISWLLYKTVEKSGIKVGKKVVYAINGKVSKIA